MRRSHLQVLTSVLLATLVGVGSYLASSAALRASLQVDAAPGLVGTVPDFVYNVPDTAPTTEDYGPVGPVSLVFAGTDVRDGVWGELEHPWIAVSSRTGDYRALSAPHLPEPGPGAVSISPDGTALAWGFAGGVVLYDPVEDEAREIGETLGENPVVGRFSPDGGHLAVHDGALHVLDLASGEVAASLGDVEEDAARLAAWTPDGAALTYVTGDRLVRHDWRSGSRTETPAAILAGSTLAWRPSGGQLAAMREVRGVRSVEVFDVAADGRIRLASRVTPDGFAQQDLLGFTSDTKVAVTALRMETGPLPLVYEMSTTNEAPPARVMQLPGPGSNWVGPETMSIAGQPLARGSSAFDEPLWPWADLSRLVVAALVALFAVGLYLTRRPRDRARRR